MAYAADALAAGEAPAPSSTMELLPLPSVLRQAAFRALVEVTLKDVHAYFFGGRRKAIQDRLREVLSDVDGPAVVIGHSLGSVISYDVLRSLDGHGPDVPLFVTVGSPLGVQEIQDVVARPLEVPRPARHWVNACDARDLVALDATLRDEFTPAERLRDYIVPNNSENHHGIGDYLRATVVQQAVHAAMELDGGPSEAGGGGQESAGGRRTPTRTAPRAPAEGGGGQGRESGEGLHSPVTNIEVESGEITETLIDEPEPGPVDAWEPAGDGTEFAGSRRELESGAVLRAPATAFPDIGVASFGGAEEVAPAPAPAPTSAPTRRTGFSTPRAGRVMESILGPFDERIRVTDTEKYPWSAVASLLITARDSSQWIGTGWFISPRTLVTAGHCVYITNSPVAARNGWVLSIQVLPGRNGTALPFGAATSSHFWTVRGWSEKGNEQYDYGAIILPTPLGETVGTFGFAVLPDADLLQKVVNITGYPGDKTPGTLWYDSRKTASVNPSKVFYEADTTGGQSGAPVYVVEETRRIGVAVHAYGGATTNSGTRISPPVFDNLTDWKE
jgi:V8-like Glu-specific endopeptidase